ncbi:MAG: polymer-forming cytoskeletal protein [Hyphomicrobiaceae bacterium]
MFNSFKSEPSAAPGPVKSSDAPAPSYPSAPAASSVHASSKSNGPNHSIVDENLTMKGDLESEGDIMVKGKVIGNISCNLLIVDREAFVEGGIRATEVIVRGRVKGNIDAERVRLERTAEVECDISQKSFSAEEGAQIKGNLTFKPEGPGGTAKVSKIDTGAKKVSGSEAAA